MRTLFRTVLPAVALIAVAGSVVAQPARIVVESRPVVEVKPVAIAPTVVVVNDAWPGRMSGGYWSYYYPSAVDYDVAYAAAVYTPAAFSIRHGACGCSPWWSALWPGYYGPTYYWPTYSWAGYYWPITYGGYYWHNYYGWLNYWPVAYNWWAVSEAKPAVARPAPQAITADRTAASLYTEARSLYWRGEAEEAGRLLSAAVQREPRDATLWYYKALAERAEGRAKEAAESARRGAALELLNPTAAPLLGLALERVQGDDRKFLRVAMDGLTIEKAEQIAAQPVKATGSVATK